MTAPIDLAEVIRNVRGIAEFYARSSNVDGGITVMGGHGEFTASPADLDALCDAAEQFDIVTARAWAAYHLGSPSWADEMLEACAMGWTIDDEEEES